MCVKLIVRLLMVLCPRDDAEGVSRSALMTLVSAAEVGPRELQPHSGLCEARISSVEVAAFPMDAQRPPDPHLRLTQSKDPLSSSVTQLSSAKGLVPPRSRGTQDEQLSFLEQSSPVSEICCLLGPALPHTCSLGDTARWGCQGVIRLVLRA